MPELTASEMSELRNVRQSVGQKLRNPEKKLYHDTEVCCICQRQKHSCKWQMRMGAVGSLACGSWCYSCKRGALKLGCGYRAEAVKQCPSVLQKLQNASACVARELLACNLDFCTCVTCYTKSVAKPFPPAKLVPTQRLRGKSTLMLVKISK